MFWRFGFHNASTIDSLLDKDDVSLEAILDEDDLLQECKSQNTRLIDYFQRVDVLQRLFAYVTGQIEGEEERGRFKYPYVATEVLCSEIWSIVETCVNSSDQLLAPFWETILDRQPEDMKTEMVMASHFAKINAVFLNKKPAEMLAFIQSQPSVVERLLRHVETPSIVDLLVRIIQLDEHPSGTGVLEWLSSEDLMGRLIDLLSPTNTSDMHTVVSELIKGIISMAAPSPGAGLTEGLQNGPASNRFARELAHKSSVSKLVGYILHDFGSSDSQMAEEGSGFEDMTSELPNVHSSTSSVVQSISIIIELIRKNNSDYFEPYLFHTLRNRLIQIQQQLQGAENARETLETAMKEMVDRMGVVHLGSVLEIMCERLDVFQKFLLHPRCLRGPVSTTVGSIAPLTFERYRICELYAELLHCSNMALLNRSSEYNHLYDNEGRLQGGLSALEQLARVIAIGSGDERDHETMDDANDEIEPALELPVTNPSRDSSILDSDEEMSDGEPGSSDDEAMEEIAMYDESPKAQVDLSLDGESPLERPPVIVPSSPNAASLPSPSEIAAQGAALSQKNSEPDSQSGKSPSSHSRKSSRRVMSSEASELPIGEKMKQRFLDMDVLKTLLDLFFEFPWNNFLHSVVYDLIHQILTGRVDGGLNRELTVALFRDARLMQRIVNGQRQNDAESAKPKGVRLGYMGHLTLISEDVIGALEHYPPDLRLAIERYAPQPAWNDYVTGRYNETKKRDTSLLGGGKPAVTTAPRNGARWKVDEEDATPALTGPATSQDKNSAKGEFRRAAGARPTRETSADFGPAPMEDEDDEEQSAAPPQFARYLAQEMQSSENFGSSSDASDEDEDGGWLAQSTFDLGKPPLPRRNHNNRHESNANGFGDAFTPSGSLREALSDDPFGVNYDEDDGFGPFSDSAAASGSDPFSFSSFTSEDIEDNSFDSFGDFGDFQASPAKDGELTPTGGSWTFTSGSESETDFGKSSSEEIPLEKRKLGDDDWRD
ncbi:SIT4 phosphatase-associated protein-domain-containing protein [Hygrophoropsis aurantiaca]|uniref:SIT4 phosphatase-associated protein-domain-containing protein n=1 Tax=Hygrophoropsis aurantiaca TaxID=72124 RepID=A0ACB8AQT2_9AGAM|nr:SIT4 phosphatase-associated protein-domain-containing protein [Hygrophoropsis aurantiaca]